MALWLPKDERRLLAGYATQIGETDKIAVFREGDLCEWLSCWWKVNKIPEYEDEEKKTDLDFEALKKAIPIHIRERKRVALANKHLAERGLIQLTQGQPEPNLVVIGVTLEGYDLGRRYASLTDRSGMWFDEYKNHWLWLIAACIGGALVKTLFDFIGSLLKA